MHTLFDLAHLEKNFSTPFHWLVAQSVGRFGWFWSCMVRLVSATSSGYSILPFAAAAHATTSHRANASEPLGRIRFTVNVYEVLFPVLVQPRWLVVHCQLGVEQSIVRGNQFLSDIMSVAQFQAFSIINLFYRLSNQGWSKSPSWLCLNF